MYLIIDGDGQTYQQKEEPKKDELQEFMDMSVLIRFANGRFEQAEVDCEDICVNEEREEGVEEEFETVYSITDWKAV